jgi:phosphoglycolate phosphatase
MNKDTNTNATPAYKLVIFDFDGTLGDSLSWLLTVLNQFADKFSIRKIPESEYETVRGLDPAQLIRHLGVPPWKIPLMGAYLRMLMARDIDKVKLYPGIRELLHCLAELGTLLAVVSSNSYANVSQVLGIETVELFKDFECGVSVFGKPPKLRKVLSKCGCSPAEAIYLGDEIRDVQAARQVGVAAGAVGWGYNTADSLRAHEPTYVFESVTDVWDALCQKPVG